MNDVERINRNHWTYIGKEIVCSLYEFIIFIVLIIKKVQWYYIAAVLILMVLYSIVKWRKTLFYIKEDTLVYESGIINRKKEEIPISKITTVDTEQGLLNRIFKVCKLKIDNGAVGEGKAELKFTLKTTLAEEFREALLRNKENTYTLEEDKEKREIKYIKASFKDLAIYALTQNKLGWILGGAFVIYGKVEDVLDDKAKEFISNKSADMIGSLENTVLNNESMALIIGGILLLIALVYIIITLISIAIVFIRYNDFKIYKEQGKIYIEYGLITKRKYSLPIEKINALKLNQSFFQQLIGIYNIEGIIVGYGDDDKKAIIYPVANRALMTYIIDELMPELHFQGKTYKPHKKTISKFIIKRVLITILILITPMYFLKIMPIIWRVIVIVLVVLWQIILGYRNYKNTSMGISSTTIVMTRGSRTKTTHIIKQDSVQSLSKKQNFLQKGIKVSNYNVDLCTNTFGEVVTVKHLDENIIEELEENLVL